MDLLAFVYHQWYVENCRVCDVLLGAASPLVNSFSVNVFHAIVKLKANRCYPVHRISFCCQVKLQYSQHSFYSIHRCSLLDLMLPFAKRSHQQPCPDVNVRHGSLQAGKSQNGDVQTLWQCLRLFGGTEGTQSRSLASSEMKTVLYTHMCLGPMLQARGNSASAFWIY